MNSLQEGMLVRHQARTEWGPGKVVRVLGDMVHVVWRDNEADEAMRLSMSRAPLAVADEQSDPLLDRMPLLLEGDDGKLRLPGGSRMNFDDARAKFLVKYPNGFQDVDYVRNERTSKMGARERFLSSLGADQIANLVADADHGELATRLLRVADSASLMEARTEMTPMKDALQNPEACLRFAAALSDVAHSPEVSAATWRQFATAVVALPRRESGVRVATWPVATIFPFLARPEAHMYFKPTVTQPAADALGFDLDYDATPNWRTYRNLLALTALWTERIADLEPRDNFDVQAFTWLACG